jgi:cytochrome c oxidase subunit 4
MSGLTEEAVKKQVRVYFGVFAALAGLTILTVAVAYLHLPLAAAIAVALLIAMFKGSLVAAFFMHLAGEKKIIFTILALAFFFFLFLLTYPALHHA